MSAEFLLEIGCEEIPAWMLPRAQTSLKELLEVELGARGLLKKDRVQVMATPRRLVATCAALAEKEPTSEKQAIGPPKSVALDAAGKPTRAAESFARKAGVRVATLKVVDTAKGPYVAAVSRRVGRPTGTVLAEVLPGLIPRIEFPRSMYWTSSKGLRFIRPIRWLVALWRGRVVQFELAGVRSGDLSYGHRMLGNKPVHMKKGTEYLRRLRAAGVVVDPAARREKILRESHRLTSGLRSRVRPDEELLETLVNSVEHPSVLRGEFAAEFLKLPDEVLVTVMRHHQKYFSVEEPNGRVSRHFLAVIDLDGDRAGEIRRNHETVLAARLRDARFFWEVDQRRSLAERGTDLERLVFQSRLGSYADKVKRIGEIVAWLGERVSADGRRADISVLARAASLCKCDLTTEMVGEFPELQGVIGGLYASVQGEPQEVSDAIHDHYKPVSPEDETPPSLSGCLLGIADRLDTLAACFSVGLAPTGSRDPFALRRAGSGVVRIVLERGLRLPLLAAVQQAVRVVQDSGIPQNNNVGTAMATFLEDRARHLFREGRGFAYDEVNAAFAAGWDDLVDTAARLEAIRRLRPTRDFEPVAAAFKRIRNILEQAGTLGRDSRPIIEEGLLEAGAERELYDRFLALRPKVVALREEHRYEEALRTIASLRPQVDRYFDTVLVMAKNELVRDNRLALLGLILREFSSVADFSEIVVRPKTKE